MRQRLHYTPNQITNNLHTTGSAWMTEDNVEYVGLFHTYTTGEVYTGQKWTVATSKRLIEYINPNINENIKVYKTLKTIQTKFTAPTPIVITLSAADIKAGYISRYFIKKYNELIITEIDIEQFNSLLAKKLDNNLYQPLQIKWIVSGTPEEVTSQNMQTLINSNLEMLGFIQHITNPMQYYSDSDYVVPKDINS